MRSPEMILKIVLGKGARGLLNYVSQLSKSAHHPHPAHKRGEPKPSAQPTFTNFAGSTPRQIATEFSALRLLKPNLTKAVGHLILSPGPTDRALTRVEWQQALDIALASHGALNTPHAAWLHADTDLQHLHVFFSRILPSGQVISDSQSYQKNRNAARQIEKELQMETFNSSPKPDASSDRQAAYNAARREERLSLKALDQTEIRNALKEAKDMAEFEWKLQALGIEVEFSRRGANQEVFGWKLRRRGEDQWQKASTLAKDLSWPKIAHRFADSPAPAPAPKSTAADDFIHAPLSPSPSVARPTAPTRRKAEPNEDDVHAGATMLVPAPITTADSERRKKRFEQRKQEIQKRVGSANFSKALAQLGLALSHFTLEMISRFVEWLKNLLSSKFGIGIQHQVTQAPDGRQRVALQVDDDTIEEEARLIEPQPEPLTLDYKLAEATEVVEEITAAIKDQDFAHMPGCESQRGAELVAELRKTIKPDPALEFSGAVTKQLKTLVAALVSNHKAEAEIKELFKDQSSEIHPLANDLEKAKVEAQRLERLDSEWGKEHWALVTVGRKGPYRAQAEAAADKMLKHQREFDSAVKKINSKWQPILVAGEKRVVESRDWMKSASSDLFSAGHQVAAFYDDPRFNHLAVSLPKHVQIVTAGVAKRLSSPQHVDLQAPVAALRQTLAEWDEVAKTPLPRADKPLPKDEQEDKPKQQPDDGFEVPR